MRLLLFLSVGPMLVIATICGRVTQVAAAPKPLEVLVADVRQKDFPLHREWIGTVVGFVNAEIKAGLLFITETVLNGVKRTVMHDQLPVIYVARHGDTAWSITGQHTGLTDLPLLRARTTCALAGFSSAAEIDNDLVQWDYGRYEGLRSAEFHVERPDWDLFRDGAPGGETPAQVAEPADNIWTRLFLKSHY